MNNWQAYGRLIVDFVLVQLCMAAAYAVAVLYHLSRRDVVMADTLMDTFASYYWFTFLPLSLLFPAVFVIAGFYTRYRTYQFRHKFLQVGRGATIAALLFLGGHYFLAPGKPAPRSVALAFCVLAVAAVSGARLLKRPLLRCLDDAQGRAADKSEPEVVLVIGGAGYIGSNLVRQLLQTGRKVRVLDNLVYGYDAIKEVLNDPNVELVIGDCRNIKTVVGAVQGVNAIVHLAAIVGDPACDHDKQTALEVNYAATRMIAEVARGAGIRRFVFASSCSVYGANEMIVDEQSAPNPISIYAQTKVDSETALLACESETFHPTILRLATVFGNSYRPRFDLVVNLLTARANQDRLITIFNGQQWRPFIHVKDIAQAILLTLDAPVETVSGEIFNVGDSRLNFTLSQIAEIIQGVFPGTAVEHIDNQDRRDYRVSFEKIHSRLGFECRWTILEGVLELKRAFEEKQITDYKDPYYNNVNYLKAAGSPSNTDAMDVRIMAAFAGDGDSPRLVTSAS